MHQSKAVLQLQEIFVSRTVNIVKTATDITVHIHTSFSIAIDLCRSSNMAVKKSSARYAVCFIYVQAQTAVLEPILSET